MPSLKRKKKKKLPQEHSVIVAYKMMVYMFLVVIIVGAIVKISLPLLTESNVLGTNTYQAIDGDVRSANNGNIDKVPEGSSGPGPSLSLQNPDNPPPPPNVAISGEPNITPKPFISSSSYPNFPSTNKVYCVGPDGKYLAATFGGCRELNAKAGKTSFLFKPMPPTSDYKPITSLHGTPPPPPPKNLDKITGAPGDSQNKFHIETKAIGNRIMSDDHNQHSLNGPDADHEVEKSLEESGVTVASSTANTTVFAKGNIRARTNLPISVDTSNNSLSVDTSAGQKEISVLPDRAIDNLLKNKVLSRVFKNETGATDSATQSEMNLTVKNGVPVYEVNGAVSKRLFGFIPVLIQKNVTVSAETGNVQSSTSPLVDRVLGAFSF